MVSVWGCALEAADVVLSWDCLSPCRTRLCHCLGGAQNKAHVLRSMTCLQSGSWLFSCAAWGAQDQHPVCSEAPSPAVG